MRLHYLIGKTGTVPVLFLHGFMGQSADWQDVISQLPSQYQTLTIDLPGHGKTWFKQPFTFENTARSIVQLLQQLPLKKYHLIGYSMGGRLGLYLLLKYPHIFDQAILESVSPGLKTEQEQQQRQQRDEQLATELERGDFQIFLNHWYEQPLFSSLKNHPTYLQMRERRQQNNPQGLAQSLREMGTGIQPSLWNKLDDYQIPTRLLAGEQDRKFVAIAHEMVSYNAHFTAHIIPKSGHNIHLEHPGVFVQEILDFLN